MPTLTTALGAVFTPAAGDFVVQATGGEAILERRQTAGAAWAGVGRFMGSVNVSNPIAGVEYRIVTAVANTTPAVQADQ
jgi:hypothetical protein